jgi:hypothetical protein
LQQQYTSYNKPRSKEEYPCTKDTINYPGKTLFNQGKKPTILFLYFQEKITLSTKNIDASKGVPQDKTLSHNRVLYDQEG